MSSLSKSIREKLAAMTEDYIKQLPGRYDEISACFSSLRNAATYESLEKLKNSLHKLAGSGATFGFDDLSARSKHVEEILAGYLAGNSVPDNNQMDELRKELNVIESICKPDEAVEELEELEEDPSGAEADSFLYEHHEGTRLLYLSPDSDSVFTEISDQLSIYGFSVEHSASLDELNTNLKNGRCRLVIVHTDYLDSRDDAAGALKKLKGLYHDVLVIVFISDTDTFNIRLRSVRAGGDALFIFPIDAGRLVDKIDKLTVRNDYPPYHILIIDDDPEQVAYYAFILQQAGMITSVASDPKRVIQVLAEAKPELILMDLYMPECSGLELASIIRQHESFLSIPIIFFSVEYNQKKQLEAIKFGADDFITKPMSPEDLILRINTKAARNRNLRFLMERDSLTGLLNHANLKEKIALELMRSRRNGSVMSFAMIDVDHFKAVNDSYGHLTGDYVLKSLARILKDRLRRTDIIGRYGGEEFGIVLTGTEADDAFHVMDEVRKNFAKVKHKTEDQEFYVTFSCGIASSRQCASQSVLSELADRAMYEAKTSGRNRTVVFSQESD